MKIVLRNCEISITKVEKKSKYLTNVTNILRITDR